MNRKSTGRNIFLENKKKRLKLLIEINKVAIIYVAKSSKYCQNAIINKRNVAKCMVGIETAIIYVLKSNFAQMRYSAFALMKNNMFISATLFLRYFHSSQCLSEICAFNNRYIDFHCRWYLRVSITGEQKLMQLLTIGNSTVRRRNLILLVIHKTFSVRWQNNVYQGTVFATTIEIVVTAQTKTIHYVKDTLSTCQFQWCLVLAFIREYVNFFKQTPTPPGRMPC